MTNDDKALVERLREEAAAYLKSVYDADPEKVDVMFTLEYQWEDKPHRHIRDLCERINEAADRIEQLAREKAVVSDLWEQQKGIALDYLADCNKASDRIEALSAEVERLERALESFQSLAKEQAEELIRYRAKYMVGTSVALEDTDYGDMTKEDYEAIYGWGGQG